jgi:hypothetical protein
MLGSHISGFITDGFIESLSYLLYVSFLACWNGSVIRDKLILMPLTSNRRDCFWLDSAHLTLMSVMMRRMSASDPLVQIKYPTHSVLLYASACPREHEFINANVTFQIPNWLIRYHFWDFMTQSWTLAPEIGLLFVCIARITNHTGMTGASPNIH